MWMTALHLIQIPAAFLGGYVLGAAARRGKLGSPWVAYALALVAGIAIAFATTMFDAAARPNEQPWQGFIVWAAWAGLGVFNGWRGPRQPTRLTTLNLSGRGH